MQEEVFGPVLSVITVDDEAEDDASFLKKAAAIVNAPERRSPLVLHLRFSILFHWYRNSCVELEKKKQQKALQTTHD